ncbi:MAG: hypothetical protein WAK31_10425 [Chthoniobacterales bacterium]
MVVSMGHHGFLHTHHHRPDGNDDLGDSLQVIGNLQSILSGEISATGAALLVF